MIKRHLQKLPEANRIRATIMEIYINGAFGYCAYLNNIDPNDTDMAIRSAMDYRFPGAVTVKNENLEYENDAQRIARSFLNGENETNLHIFLRTFSTDQTTEYKISMPLYWFNLPEDVIIPDITVYHDCHEYDCDTIAMQVTGVIPLDRSTAEKTVPQAEQMATAGELEK